MVRSTNNKERNRNETDKPNQDCRSVGVGGRSFRGRERRSIRYREGIRSRLGLRIYQGLEETGKRGVRCGLCQGGITAGDSGAQRNHLLANRRYNAIKQPE